MKDGFIKTAAIVPSIRVADPKYNAGKIIDGMKNYTSEEIEAALRAAGFSEVTSDHHPSKPWITVLARK